MLRPRPHPRVLALSSLSTHLASRATLALPLTAHLRRFLTTTRRLARPVPNSSPYPSLLRRDPSRDLPSLSSLSPTRRWLTTLPLFIAILTASALGIFNFQKVNSPVITATLYGLRTNPVVRERLGDEVYFASRWAWVWGTINLVQGRVDVRFRVKGTRGAGMCRFRARRLGSRAEAFTAEEWSLQMDGDGEKVLSLLESAQDPLRGHAM